MKDKSNLNISRRYCSSCQFSKPIEGGEFKAIQGGLRHRWVCFGCRQARLNRTKPGVQPNRTDV